MDFDPRITSDGKGYGTGHGWSCNFHFGHGHDVIDEDAENEKCCVQVLHLMIAKADAEIDDLEDELAILQCQLKWTESDKQRDPYEVCCATFRQKIDSLTSSIQRLRNENAASSYVMDEALEIQGPIERIYDIINTLIGHNFSDPSEQVVSNQKKLLSNLDSLGNDIDLKQQDTTLKSSVEFGKQKEVPERKEKSGLTISEESSSDAARYAAKDTKEEIYMSKYDDDVIRNAELDAYRWTSEEKSGALVLKPVVTQTHLLVSTSEGNSKLDALQQGEHEKCITGSETGETGSSSWLGQVVIKAEEDDYDTGICHIAIDSFSKLLDHERDIPVENHLKVTKNWSQSVVDAHITYGRIKPSLSSILKPRGWKVQRKLHSDLGVARQSIPTPMLKPLGEIGNMKSPSNPENSTQSGSPFEEEGRFSFLQETDIQRKSGNSGAKKQQIQGVGKDSANVLSPLYDLDNLRLNISQDPEFLKKLKVPELKEIARKNKLLGFNKLKKEKMIEELIKQLNLERNRPTVHSSS